MWMKEDNPNQSDQDGYSKIKCTDLGEMPFRCPAGTTSSGSCSVVSHVGIVQSKFAFIPDSSDLYLST